METLAALVRTRNFPEQIKAQAELLKTYVIDYADCSMFSLETQGYYRYRQLCEYISGEKEPNKLVSILKERDDNGYFCNKNKMKISLKEFESIIVHPNEYALVLYNCFR